MSSPDYDHAQQITYVPFQSGEWPEITASPVEPGDERYVPLATDGSYVGHPLRPWQQRALGAWEDNNFRGVIEAITGTGKSLVGIAAARQVLALGGVALVLVPSRALLEQWYRDIRTALPRARVGRLSGDHRDTFAQCNVLIATVQTASRTTPRPPSLGLLIADEAHRYGSAEFSKALVNSFERRMALSGTYERQGDALGTSRLDEYFGGVIYSYGYAAALEEQVVAPFHLALIGVDFTSNEQNRFKQATKRCEDARASLTLNYDYPHDWSDFFAKVTETARSASWRDEEEQLCSSYLSGFAERRGLMAEASAKEQLVAQLAPAFASLSGTLVFSETKDGARRLEETISPHASCLALTSDSVHDDRRLALSRFGRGEIKVLCAPRILDEGIDVPEAELALIAAASQSRRQMVQRMGRVVRLKEDGRAARIVMLYVKGTPEDWTTGGHEAFLHHVVPFARTAIDFGPDMIDDIKEWMQDREW